MALWGPRPCLAYGLLILVLLVIWSGRHLSSLGDVIWGSTWNYPNKDPFLYIGIHHQHANGRSSDHVRHRHTLFRPLFRLVCHRNMVRWKDRIMGTTVVLNLRWLWKEFPSRMYHQYDGTIIHSIHRRSRLIAVWWVPGTPGPVAIVREAPGLILWALGVGPCTRLPLPVSNGHS